MRLKAIAPALAAIVLSAVAARTAGATTVELQALGWQGRAVTAAKLVPVEFLDLSNGQKVAGRFQAALELLNRGADVEGVLVRYSVEAKIAPEDHPDQAAWAVPFVIDERRVPRIAADSRLEVPLDASTMTDIYIKDLALEGYAVESLKIRAMISPRRGQPGPVQVLESELPVHWKVP